MIWHRNHVFNTPWIVFPTHTVPQITSDHLTSIHLRNRPSFSLQQCISANILHALLTSARHFQHLYILQISLYLSMHGIHIQLLHDAEDDAEGLEEAVYGDAKHAICCGGVVDL